VSRKPPESASQAEWDAFLVAEGMPPELKPVVDRSALNLDRYREASESHHCLWSFVQNSAQDAMARAFSPLDALNELLNERPEELNSRELVVMTLFADGYGRPTIARRLGLSEHAVRWAIECVIQRFQLPIRGLRACSRKTNCKTREYFLENQHNGERNE
jgi:DNA-binding NarL/FixJ family response regulator